MSRDKLDIESWKKTIKGSCDIVMMARDFKEALNELESTRKHWSIDVGLLASQAKRVAELEKGIRYIHHTSKNPKIQKKIEFLMSESNGIELKGELHDTQSNRHQSCQEASG